VHFATGVKGAMFWLAQMTFEAGPADSVDHKFKGSLTLAERNPNRLIRLELLQIKSAKV